MWPDRFHPNHTVASVGFSTGLLKTQIRNDRWALPKLWLQREHPKVAKSFAVLLLHESNRKCCQPTPNVCSNKRGSAWREFNPISLMRRNLRCNREQGPQSASFYQLNGISFNSFMILISRQSSVLSLNFGKMCLKMPTAASWRFPNPSSCICVCAQYFSSHTAVVITLILIRALSNNSVFFSL